jgi:hypothetical protein
VIEAIYRVRCSGPCRLYLTPDGPQRGDYPDLGEYDTRHEAEAAAAAAGWAACTEHAGHLIIPGTYPTCLTMCPECRTTKETGR